MTQIAKISFETAYRQLPAADRAFVDDFVSRIEAVSERSGQEMQAILIALDFDSLPVRDREHLSRALVRSAIAERVRDLTEAQNVSARRIMKEIAALAFSSIDHYRRPGASLQFGIAEYEGFDGGLFELEYATPEQRAAVKEVEIEEQVRSGKIKTKIKLHDKLGALRMLGQIRGLFDQDGNAVNPELWAQEGGVPVAASLDDVQDLYAQVINGA